jgi:hypothetical protein
VSFFLGWIGDADLEPTAIRNDVVSARNCSACFLLTTQTINLDNTIQCFSRHYPILGQSVTSFSAGHPLPELPIRCRFMELEAFWWEHACWSSNGPGPVHNDFNRGRELTFACALSMADSRWQCCTNPVEAVANSVTALPGNSASLAPVKYGNRNG